VSQLNNFLESLKMAVHRGDPIWRLTMVENKFCKYFGAIWYVQRCKCDFKTRV